MCFFKLIVLGFSVLNMVVQLLDFVGVDLVLLSLHLLLLGKLVLVGLTKSINFIYPLFMFVDLMVSESFLASCFSLVFIDLGHALLLKVNDFLVQLLTLLLFFLEAFFKRSYLDTAGLQVFLVLGKLLVKVIHCTLVFGVSFIHHLLSILDFTLERLHLRMSLTQLLLRCFVVSGHSFQFSMFAFKLRLSRCMKCFQFRYFL